MSFSIKKLQDGYWFCLNYQGIGLSGLAASRSEALRTIFQILRKESLWKI